MATSSSRLVDQESSGTSRFCRTFAAMILSFQDLIPLSSFFSFLFFRIPFNKSENWHQYSEGLRYPFHPRRTAYGNYFLSKSNTSSSGRRCGKAGLSLFSSRREKWQSRGQCSESIWIEMLTFLMWRTIERRGPNSIGEHCRLWELIKASIHSASNRALCREELRTFPFFSLNFPYEHCTDASNASWNRRIICVVSHRYYRVDEQWNRILSVIVTQCVKINQEPVALPFNDPG